MKIKFTKSGRIGDAEILITCHCQISSQLAAMQINDLVKERALDLARDVRDLSAQVKANEEDVKKKAIPVMQSIADALINEPPLRLREKEKERE